MDGRLLIDAIVRQTTLLIAQLATSAGIRAPLAHLADQVFVDLAREIEQQGVSRKVAADMFGLALRTYQRKVARLSESVSVPDKTLWQAVLEHVSTRSYAVTRSEVLAGFRQDDEEAVIAVLNDLVAGGLLYATGRGKRAAYGATTRGDQEALLRERTQDTLLHLVWLELATPQGRTREELAHRFPESGDELDRVLAKLVEDGRASVEARDGTRRYVTSQVLIPVGSEEGWETAVLDHFRAVCSALIRKLRDGASRQADATHVGGTTLSFDLVPGHPFEDEVRGLLTRVRRDAVGLWQRVSAYNTAHPPQEDKVERVIFYVGQNQVAIAGCEDGER